MLYCVYFFAFLSLLVTYGYTQAEWTVLLVMQGDNNLSFAMHQNIELFQKNGSNKKLNILVQWDEPLKHTTWRYKVGNHKLIHDASLPQDMGDSPHQELIDAAAWAFKNYPAKQYALILWGHGSGSLEEKKNWKNYWKHHRGILYDFSSKKCLSSTELQSALYTIQHSILGGKKLDLLGMDACLMAMVEIAFQVKDSAKIMVASQNIQYAPGWHYDEIFQNFREAADTYSPLDVAQLIVQTYSSFNQHKNGIYTESIIELSAVDSLAANIDEFASWCIKHQEAAQLIRCIKQARKKCLDFDKGHFVDLFDFYNEMESAVKKNKKLKLNKQRALLSLLQEGKRLLNVIVLGSCSGIAVSQAHGLSIYFPRDKTFHRPYLATRFAQETAWPLFLKTFGR